VNPPVLERARAPAFSLAALSDTGTERSNNEDCCGHFLEGETSALLLVADGLGGYEGGEVASRMAVELTLDSYRESPAAWGAAKRLQRAVQRANIEIHNRALVVPELRRMATTLTAAVIDEGKLFAAHVGDCRLYLIRSGRILQLTKDHTVIAERVRMGLLSAERARAHPERSVLSRCVGRELIVSVDRLSMPLLADDRLILCSDGLYNVLEDSELQQIASAVDAETACRNLIDNANRRGTPDNLTAAVALIHEAGSTLPANRGWLERVTAKLTRTR
jgi:serine/threonine protein phosphatase PrpC